MEILGVGPLEILFILIIALIVLGPKDMVQAGRTMGKWMRKLVTSPTYAIFQKTSRDLRNLPYRLMREAGTDEIEAIRKSIPTAQEIMPKTPILPTPGESDPWDMGLKDWTNPQPAPRPTEKPGSAPTVPSPTDGKTARPMEPTPPASQTDQSGAPTSADHHPPQQAPETPSPVESDSN